jgi:N,N-dimethylformamidase beta subunit-like, C-terminal/Tachylectin
MALGFVTSDDESNIYAGDADTGGLLYYRDLARDGTSEWAYGGQGQRIGTGWNTFAQVFSGGDGVIYGITPDGELLYYRDLARDGTPEWAYDGQGQRIGTGWNTFTKVFSGGDGVIYGITPDGELLYYRDLARDGTAHWAYGGQGQRIGTGWNTFTKVFSGGYGIIYGITPDGELLFYRDLARDGTADWAYDGQGQQIDVGWNNFTHVFSGGHGVIYAIAPDGFLFFYRDLPHDGTSEWAYGGEGQSIGTGWLMDAPSGMVVGYCTPLSAAPGEQIEFRASSPEEYQVTYVRLGVGSAVGQPVSDTFSVDAGSQPIPPDCWETGPEWESQFDLEVPTDWASGMYAARCVDSSGDETYVVFIVNPSPDDRAPIAVLASTNTWNAYNDWGGRSKYTTPPAAKLSFARPNPSTSPVAEPPNHLTRAELWILGWLHEQGYRADLYTERDFHDGIQGLDDYRALVLNTHPEYWTLAMFDNLEAYIAGGGTVLYLGGNGLFERVEFEADGDGLICLNGDPSQARPFSYFCNLDPPRPERDILGVGTYMGLWMTFAPYEVLSAAHPLFSGTGLANGDLIGQAGLNGGGASGWEIDTSKPGLAPPGVVVSGTSQEDDRGTAPDGTVLLARGTNSSDYGADMTCWDTPAGGRVFSVGSLSFGGSLVIDSSLQTIVRNVLDAAL